MPGLIQPCRQRQFSLAGMRLRVTACVALLLATLTGPLPAWAQEREVWRVPTPFVENGQAVTLEVVVIKPPGPGPFPTLVFTHGSTTNGNDPREVRHTVVYPELAAFFNGRGWMAAFVQRRGRGQSGGSYDEGWDPVQSRYGCSLDLATRTVEHAMADMEAAHQFLAADPRVARSAMLAGGNSRGGVLALLLAKRHPQAYRGTLNLVGAWAGQRCELMHDINAPLFRAAASAVPSLWFYGQRDRLYPEGYGAELSAVYQAAGGKAEMHLVTQGPLRNDHNVIRAKSLWEGPLADFLDRLAVPRQ